MKQIESHLSDISYQHSNYYPATDRKFSVMRVTEYWIYTILSQIHNIMMNTAEIVGNFRRSVKNDTLM